MPTLGSFSLFHSIGMLISSLLGDGSVFKAVLGDGSVFQGVLGALDGAVNGIIAILIGLLLPA
ncbi:MAG: hypothetical protein U1A27_10695 [Phycisphaerae bacterium]